MNMIEKKLSQWQGRIKLRTLALWVMIPLCVIAGLFTFPIMRFMDNLSDFSMSLRTRLVPQIVNTQATFVNLESLNRSLNTLKYSVDTERARHAYIDSWSVVMESLYDRPEKTQTVLYRMAYDVEELWKVRQALDAVRGQVFNDWQTLYMYGVSLHAYTNSDARHHDQSVFLNYETTTRFSFQEEIRVSFESFYNEHRALCKSGPSNVQEICRLMSMTKERLSEHFSQMQGLSDKFYQKIRHIDEHMIDLTEQLSSLEIHSSMKMVDEVSDLSRYVKHAITFFAVLFFIILALLVLLVVFVLWPLTRLSSIGRDFRVSMKRPSCLPMSIVYEIQEMIQLMPLLFADIEQKHQQAEALTEHNEKLANENKQDALTGIANRRILDTVRQEGVKAGNAVLMFDLDHFKSINDTKGHPFGDFVLQTVAQVLRQHLNRNDLLCRYGGEEFCAVLHEVNQEQARLVAERLVKLIRVTHVVSPEGIECDLTMSVGVSLALSPADSLTLDELIDQADKALYEAKSSGRDRVCVFEA